MDKYYVYIYLNPLKAGNFEYFDLKFDFEPFYIGKGKNCRKDRHISDCFNKSNKKGYRRLFYQKLRKILKTGVEPTIIVYKNNISEKEAFQIEIDLISKIGRRIYKKGPLCNNSIGGEGASGVIAPRLKIYVYNTIGDKIDEGSISFLTKKYSTTRKIIGKQYSRLAIKDKNGLRFRKENLPKIDPYIIPKHRKIKKDLEVYNKENVLINTYFSVKLASLDTELKPSSIRNNLAKMSNFCKSNKFGKIKFKYKIV